MGSLATCVRAMHSCGLRIELPALACGTSPQCWAVPRVHSLQQREDFIFAAPSLKLRGSGLYNPMVRSYTVAVRTAIPSSNQGSCLCWGAFTWGALYELPRLLATCRPDYHTAIDQVVVNCLRRQGG